MAEVMHSEPGFRMPRIVMHVCSASITTATPLTCNSSTSRLAICSVMRSWTCGPAGKFVDHPGQLAQTHDPRPGQIGNVGLAQKRQHVVLAHALEADIADQDHFVVALGEKLLQMPAGIKVQAREELGIHAGHPGRCFLKPLAIGIFANGHQNLADGTFDPGMVDLARTGCGAGIVPGGGAFARVAVVFAEQAADCLVLGFTEGRHLPILHLDRGNLSR